MKAIILIFFLSLESCAGTYPFMAVNSCGRIVRKDKVNNVCEFDSVKVKFQK